MRKGVRLLHPLAVLLALLAFAGMPVQARAASQGQPALTVTAEPGSVAVGETFRLVLIYTLPAGAKLEKVPDIRGLDGLSVSKRELIAGRIALSIVADRLDPIRVGPVTLGYNRADGQKAYLSADAVTVDVKSNTKGQEEPRPIKGIIPTKSLWATWAAFAGIALLALAALGGAFWAWKRWRRGGAASARAEAPHVLAEREIDALLKESLFEQGKPKEFYFRFTEIVKRYLEALRGFPAAELTTEELSSRVGEADRPVLSLLRFADLVKFADGEASPERRDDDVSTFLAYLDVTAPREPAGAAAQGEGTP